MRKILALGIIVLFVSSAGISCGVSLGRTPPSTVIILDPPVPNGANGWYVTPVQVSFVNGSGTTYYQINNGSWITYTAPFVLGEDGVYVIGYYSGEEIPKTFVIYLDQTAPCGFQDNTSGVQRVEWYIGGILQFNDTDGSDGWWYVIHPFPQGDNLTLTAKVYDMAGNYEEINFTEISGIGIRLTSIPEIAMYFAFVVEIGGNRQFFTPISLTLSLFHGRTGAFFFQGFYCQR